MPAGVVGGIAIRGRNCRARGAFGGAAKVRARDCADRRAGNGHRDGRDVHLAGATAVQRGISHSGDPVILRPHLQRGFHGDRGESEHATVTTVTR